jgi:hypothetical protein
LITLITLLIVTLIALLVTLLIVLLITLLITLLIITLIALLIVLLLFSNAVKIFSRVSERAWVCVEQRTIWKLEAILNEQTVDHIVTIHIPIRVITVGWASEMVCQ